MFRNLKGKNKVVLCDDYGKASFIKEVKNAIDDFSEKNNIQIKIISDRFAELIFKKNILINMKKYYTNFFSFILRSLLSIRSYLAGFLFWRNIKIKIIFPTLIV